LTFIGREVIGFIALGCFANSPNGERDQALLSPRARNASQIAEAKRTPFRSLGNRPDSTTDRALTTPCESLRRLDEPAGVALSRFHG